MTTITTTVLNPVNFQLPTATTTEPPKYSKYSYYKVKENDSLYAVMGNVAKAVANIFIFLANHIYQALPINKKIEVDPEPLVRSPLEPSAPPLEPIKQVDVQEEDEEVDPKRPLDEKPITHVMTLLKDLKQSSLQETVINASNQHQELIESLLPEDLITAETIDLDEDELKTFLRLNFLLYYEAYCEENNIDHKNITKNQERQLSVHFNSEYIDKLEQEVLLKLQRSFSKESIAVLKKNLQDLQQGHSSLAKLSGLALGIGSVLLGRYIISSLPLESALNSLSSSGAVGNTTVKGLHVAATAKKAWFWTKLIGLRTTGAILGGLGIWNKDTVLSLYQNNFSPFYEDKVNGRIIDQTSILTGQLTSSGLKKITTKASDSIFKLQRDKEVFKERYTYGTIIASIGCTTLPLLSALAFAFPITSAAVVGGLSYWNRDLLVTCIKNVA